MTDVLRDALHRQPSAEAGWPSGPTPLGQQARRRTARHAGGDDHPRLRRALRVLIAVLAVVLALEVGFAVLVAPQLRLTAVEVRTDLQLTDADVLRLAGLSGQELFFEVDPAAVRERLLAHPLVGDARVVRQFPDRLHLTLHGRQPLAVALVRTASGAAVPVEVDAGGVPFRVGVPEAGDLPVLTGLAAADIVIGEPLPEPLRTLLADLEALTAVDPALASLLSELRIVSPGTSPVAQDPPLSAGDLAAGFDTVVYPVGYQIPVRFGERLPAERLTRAVLLLDLLDVAGVRELDVRNGPPVAVLAPGDGSEPVRDGS